MDVVMLELTSISLILGKFGIGADGDFEENFMFPNGLEILKGLTLATYYAINERDFKLVSDD